MAITAAGRDDKYLSRLNDMAPGKSIKNRDGAYFNGGNKKAALFCRQPTNYLNFILVYRLIIKTLHKDRLFVNDILILPYLRYYNRIKSKPFETTIYPPCPGCMRAVCGRAAFRRHRHFKGTERKYHYLQHHSSD